MARWEGSVEKYSEEFLRLLGLPLGTSCSFKDLPLLPDCRMNFAPEVCVCVCVCVFVCMRVCVYVCVGAFVEVHSIARVMKRGKKRL